jgi:MFS transporter, DHA2 family, multidrug resistance protein
MFRLICLYVVLAVHVLDTSIANLALVAIARDLQIESLEGQWVVSTFAVGVGVAIVMAGQISDWAGEQAALCIGLIASVICSFATGSAGSFAQMAAFRVCHGLAAGIVISVGQKLLVEAAGPERRAFGLSLWSSAIAIAPVVGPLLGAVVVQSLSWRWIFWLNSVVVLLCGLALSTELRVIPERKAPAPDLVAPTLIAVALISLEVLIDLTFGPATLAGPKLALVSASLLGSGAALVLHRRWTGRAVFEWGLFANHHYLAFTSIAVLVNGLLLTASVFFPIWLQLDYGLPLSHVASVMASGGVIAGVSSPFVGKLVPRRYFPGMVVLSLGVLALSFWLTGHLETASSLWQVVLPRLCVGVALTLFSPAAYLAISKLPDQAFIAANGLSMFLRSAVATLILGLSTGAMRSLGTTYAERAIANGIGELQIELASAASALQVLAETRAMQTGSLGAAALCALLAAVVLLLRWLGGARAGAPVISAQRAH